MRPNSKLITSSRRFLVVSITSALLAACDREPFQEELEFHMSDVNQFVDDDTSQTDSSQNESPNWSSEAAALNGWDELPDGTWWRQTREGGEIRIAVDARGKSSLCGEYLQAEWAEMKGSSFETREELMAFCTSYGSGRQIWASNCSSKIGAECTGCENGCEAGIFKCKCNKRLSSFAFNRHDIPTY